MEMKFSKISFFLPVLVGGGAERVLINLANIMREEGIQVDFLVGSKEGELQKELDGRINIIEFKKNKTIKCLPKLARYLRTCKPDALITGLDHVNLVGIWANILSGYNVKHIVTLHNAISVKIKKTSKFSPRRIIPFLIKIFYQHASSIVGVSNGVLSDYHALFNFPKEKTSVINNPVINQDLFKKSREYLDHPWFNGLNSDPIVITVGRMVEQKRQIDLLKAINILNKKRNVKLIILGEGKLRRNLEEYIKVNQMEDCVLLPGFVENPYKYILRSNIFVLSSGWEGLPTVLIEAGGLGVPVISTNCQYGPAEILENGKYGRLVSIGDVDHLSEAIEEVLNAPKQTFEKVFIEKYSSQRIVKEYLALLH